MLGSVWGNIVGKNTKLEFSKGATYHLISEELALPLSMKFVYLETGSASFYLNGNIFGINWEGTEVTWRSN